MEKKGGVWNDNLRADNAALALVESGSFRGSVAKSNYQKCITETVWSERSVLDSLLTEIPVNQKRYITMRADGVPWCHICNKGATGWHIESAGHIMNMEETSLSDIMGGQTNSGFRRFRGLCEGTPTKKLMMDFWGNNLSYLPQHARQVHIDKGAFYINSKLDKPITVDQATHELGIVSYTGYGKYAASTYIAFHNLPDSEDVASAEELQVTSPAGQGWWPVISLAEDYCATNGRSVLLVCFYQLQLKEDIVPVWRIWPNYVAEARPGLQTVPEAKAMPKVVLRQVMASAAPSAKASTTRLLKACRPKAAPSQAPRLTGVWAEEDNPQAAAVPRIIPRTVPRTIPGACADALGSSNTMHVLNWWAISGTPSNTMVFEPDFEEVEKDCRSCSKPTWAISGICMACELAPKYPGQDLDEAW